MTIQLPPKEPCPIVWPKFVEWLFKKMFEDLYSHEPDPVRMTEVVFRQHTFEYCPFCGLKLEKFGCDGSTGQPMQYWHP